MAALGDLFSPERVAIVGATERDGSVGRAIVENLLADFEGTIVPVNPSRDTVLDMPCVNSLSEAGEVDLAVVIVPADVVIDVAREAGELGITNLVVISAGFEEAGSEGAKRSEQLANLAAEYDLTIIGPNSLGIMSPSIGLNATFAPRMASSGPVSFMSQSGAIVTAVLDWAQEQGIGFRHIVSLGNKLDVDEAALLEAWDEDPGTEVIIGYLESVPRGRRFMEAAKRVSADTPVVLVKAGRTDAGAQAASSHTGAMAGSDRIIEAAFRQSGVVRASSIADLFDAGDILAGQPVPIGPGLGVVSNAGGPAVMATDAAAEAGLTLAEFSSQTQATLADELPAAADPYNPVDMLGDADKMRFRTTLESVATDEHVDSLLVLSAPVATVSYAGIADEILRIHKRHELPTVTCLMGSREQTMEATERLRDRGIPNYFDPARAVKALGALETYRRRQQRPMDDAPSRPVDDELATSILDRARSKNRQVVGLEAMELFDAYGIETPPGGLAKTPKEAQAIAEEVAGDTVVMKIVSPDISHKTDVGGVRVGVDIDDIPDTYEDLIATARRYREDASVIGIYVQEMVDVDDGVEVIVGANRDPQFGPVVLFGLGGIFVEVLEDVTVRVCPIGEATAEEMLDEIEASPLLQGTRGRQAVDRTAIADALFAIDCLIRDHDDILEVDINPLVATSEGALAIDLRITLEAT